MTALGNSQWHKARLVIASGLCFIGIGASLAACTDTAQAQSGGYQVSDSVTPKFPTNQMIGLGAYPLIVKSNFNPTPANRAIRAVVVGAEMEFERSENIPRPKDFSNVPGGYWIGIDPQLMSASPTLISGLLPVAWVGPGDGVGVKDWISFTVSLPKGNEVRLERRIFFNEKEALDKLASLSSAYLKSENSCFAMSSNKYAVSADPENYSKLAISTRGLAIGFVGAGMCKYAEVTIPFNEIDSLLNTFGRKLTRSLGRPDFLGLSKKIIKKGPYLGG